MQVVAYDPFANAEVAKNNGIELTTLDEVFKQADYLSIHSPLTDDTRGMINKDMSEGTATDGGYTVPEDIQNKMLLH